MTFRTRIFVTLLAGAPLATILFGPPRVALACGSDIYSASGRIVAIAADGSTITFAHAGIEGYLRAGNLQVRVRSAKQIQGFAPEDAVLFQIVVEEDGRIELGDLRRSAPGGDR
jgi:hypothetical protein